MTLRWLRCCVIAVWKWKTKPTAVERQTLVFLSFLSFLGAGLKAKRPTRRVERATVWTRPDFRKISPCGGRVKTPTFLQRIWPELRHPLDGSGQAAVGQAGWNAPRALRGAAVGTLPGLSVSGLEQREDFSVCDRAQQNNARKVCYVENTGQLLALFIGWACQTRPNRRLRSIPAISYRYDDCAGPAGLPRPNP